MRSVQILVPLCVLAGCGSTGRYDLSWRFTGGQEGAPFSAKDCGEHGVDALRLAAHGGSSDSDGAVVPCGLGHVLRGVPTGAWTLDLVALGRDGQLKEPADSPLLKASGLAFAVSEGQTTTVAATLDPQPACRDGVDNDDDGAVDLADPGCMGDPEGPAE